MKPPTVSSDMYLLGDSVTRYERFSGVPARNQARANEVMSLLR